MTLAVFKQVSIRVKLAVLAGGVIGLVVLGQTFQTLSAEAVAIQESINLRARLTLMSLASAIGPLWTADNTPRLEPFVTRINNEFRVRSLAIITADGTVVAWHGEKPTPGEVHRTIRLRLRTAPRSLWALGSGPLEFLVSSPIVRGIEVRGYLLCTFSSGEPAERLKDLVQDAIWTALLWMAIGGGLTLWITRRLTEPLVHLGRDLRTMSQGGYSIPPDGRADGELGVVQDRLVELSDSLRNERLRVSELTEALRHQVMVVTKDLERVAEQRQTILDSVRDGIILLNHEGQVLVTNDPARALFGEEITTSHAPLLARCVQPETVRHAIEQALKLAQPIMIHVETLPTPAHPEGRKLRVRLAPVMVTPHQPASVVLVAEDITATLRLEEQMSRSERLAALGTLTAGLAHQIGNYLNAIKGYADLLSRRLDSQSEAGKDAATIQKEVRNAAALMDKMLFLARTRPPSRAPIKVASIVKEAVDFVRVQARHSNIRIEERLAPESSSVWGDPQLLTQAFLNLLINAIQAMPEGGALAVSSESIASGQCLVRIADTGVGMTAEVKRQIFHPFFTTKPEGEGTGLGLAITHRIIELHDGVVRVQSTPGQGTVFEVELPVGPPQGGP